MWPASGAIDAETGRDTTCGPAASSSDTSTSQQQCTPTVATGSTAAIADDTRSTLSSGVIGESRPSTSSANGSSMTANCGECGRASATAAATARVWALIAARLTSNARSGAAPARNSATPTEIGPAKCHATGPV